MGNDKNKHNETDKVVNIVCYNMHGFRQGYAAVDDLIDNFRPDVFALQEHWLTPANLSLFDSHFKDYFSFGSSAMSKTVESGMLYGRPFGGVMFLINNNLRNITETIYSEERFTIVRIANYLIINVYLPCVNSNNRHLICDDVIHGISSWCDRYSECDVILCGDFNVNLDNQSDAVADMLRSLMSKYNLNRCDDLFPEQKTETYVNDALGHRSHIDYILTSCSSDVSGFLVLDHHINFSDHLPLHVSVTISSQTSGASAARSAQTTKRTQKQLRWDKADLSAYYNETASNLAHLLPILDKLLSRFDTYNHSTSECIWYIDAIYDEIVYALCSSAKLFVPVHRKNFFKFWWTEDLKVLKEASVDSDRLWKAAGKPRSGSLYQKRQSSRLLYRKRLREAQQSETAIYTNELHDALLKKESNVFWKCWRSKFESRNKCTEVEGCVESSVIVNKFFDHFSKSYTCNDTSRAEKLKEEYCHLRENYCGLSYSLYDLNFDVELISNIIKDLKRGKAADIDSLTAEHLLYSHPILPLIITKLFRLIILCRYIPDGFKRSYIIPIPKLKDCRTKAMTCDDFRGIAISPILSKVFEYCLLDRLQPVFSSAENQFGFKKGLGCSHAVFTVRNIVDHFVSHGNTANLCAIDLSKAFDKINHYGLFIKLMKRHIPKPVLELIESLTFDCYACVKWEDGWSATFVINYGVRQGSVLSPFLFAIYLDTIYTLSSPENNLFIILYADDILLITQSVVDLQKVLSKCERELEYLDMMVNARKSCCIRIGPRHHVQCADITSSSGQVIPWVTKIRYLGIYIVKSNKFKCSLDEAKRSFYKAANAIFGKIGTIASEDVTLQLISQKCVPILLYGLEACPLSSSQVNSLDFAVNRFFMKLFKTSNIETVRYCQQMFNFKTPGEQITRKTEKFIQTYNSLDMYKCFSYK